MAHRALQLGADTRPVDGADLIELAVVNGWKRVTKKGEYSAGDAVISCETRDGIQFISDSCCDLSGNLINHGVVVNVGPNEVSDEV